MSIRHLLLSVVALSCLLGAPAQAELQEQQGDNKTEMTPVVKQSFVNGCSSSPDMKLLPPDMSGKICGCMADGISSYVPRQEWYAFVTASAAAQNGGPKPDIQKDAPHFGEVVQMCVKQTTGRTPAKP